MRVRVQDRRPYDRGDPSSGRGRLSEQKRQAELDQQPGAANRNVRQHAWAQESAPSFELYVARLHFRKLPGSEAGPGADQG